VGGCGEDERVYWGFLTEKYFLGNYIFSRKIKTNYKFKKIDIMRRTTKNQNEIGNKKVAKNDVNQNSELFNRFLENFANGDSFLTEEKDIFTKENIKHAIKPLINFAIGDAKRLKKIEFEKKDFKDLKSQEDRFAFWAVKLSIELKKKSNSDGEYPEPSFNDKIFEQYEIEDLLKEFRPEGLEVNDQDRLILAHILWLRMLPISDYKTDSKASLLDSILNKNKKPKRKKELLKLFTDEGVASYSMNKTAVYHEVLFLFELLYRLKDENNNKSKHDLILKVKTVVLNFRNDEEFEPKIAKELKRESLPILNMLLYLCAPDFYEPISSNTEKIKIAQAFQSLIQNYDNETESNDKNEKDIIDEQLNRIRIKIESILNKPFNFYDKGLKIFWQYDSMAKETDFNELTALRFKKQIILYGPPGTSKTYAAEKIAETIIFQEILNKIKSSKELFEMLLTKQDNIIEYFRSRLQLHANYSYEDFVRGLKITGNETTYKNGNFLELIDKISNPNKNDDLKNPLRQFQESGKIKLPFVLILDEINRTDLSKLFGELFSGLENRGKEIELPGIGKDKEPVKISIPKNLYIIGTMNEIDFSVERIDFALRRRFAWIEYNYDEKRLRNIMIEKINAQGQNLKIQSLFDGEEFIEPLMNLTNNATRLNRKIQNNTELGSQWQIGHTFFAEVIDIAKQHLEANPGRQTKTLIKDAIKIGSTKFPVGLVVLHQTQ
jgi:5-methylcytosine-specific restriction enzyme B